MNVLSKSPIQYASGYTLDLYCDHVQARPFIESDAVHGYDEFPHSFFGETFAECAKQARAKGWKIHRTTRTATCPKCR